MPDPVILDVETQFTFQEASYDHKKLKISVACIYDYSTANYYSFEEGQLRELFSFLEHASRIIGFNLNKFDLPVLAPYYVGNMSHFDTYDLLEEAEKVLGHRISLDDMARATLGYKKSGHGLLAIDYFRKGEMQKLKDYCMDDVKITKELYEYLLKNERFSILTPTGKRDVRLSVAGLHPAGTKTVPLSLPF